MTKSIKNLTSKSKWVVFNHSVTDSAEAFESLKCAEDYIKTEKVFSKNEYDLELCPADEAVKIIKENQL